MMRSSSPAFSEISVGSPSPPPTATAANSNAFRTISLKRLRAQSPQQMQVPRKTKSFSIADILGKKEENSPDSDSAHSTPLPFSSCQRNLPPTQTPNRATLPLSKCPAPPSPTLLPANLTSQWNGLPVSVVPTTIPHHLHPFFPPALLQYDPRLAWDYHRQFQEHFQIQAQLLRQMGMDPGIIPSDDGSERSHSNFTGSDCSQSPDVSVVGNDNNNSKIVGEKDANIDEDDSNDKQEKQDNDTKKNSNANDTPLDALFQLSTKNFDEDQDPAALDIFATRQNPKKKRKSRTAFTNHQIFELEKRFLYQKYLSPADRDEIAGGLGLSNAQVITWFQNRRAKLKRDMEELKKDVESVKQLSAHKSFLENVNDLSILKTRPVSRHQQPSLPTPTPTPAIEPATTYHQFHQPSIAISSTTITTTPTPTTTTTTTTTCDEKYQQQLFGEYSTLPTTTTTTTGDTNIGTQRLQIHNSRG